jgi:membrane fusion protein, copper/silver efflux system
MKKRAVFIVVIVLLAIAAGTFTVIKLSNPKVKKETLKILYYKNPMDPSITSPVPAKDEMGMEYIPVYEQVKKVLFYRNPMNPNITSPVPAKDEMGMDYVPVYEDKNKEPGVSISENKQKAAGIETEKVRFRPFTTTVTASGKVAYDPDLYVAQSEYLQSLKTVNAVKDSPISSDFSNSLLSAGRRKLQLLGMTSEQISELERSGKPQEDLTLSGSMNTVWVYLQVFEKDMGSVNPGMPVSIDSVAYPGLEFTGQVVSLAPVLDPETRSVQVRVRVVNTGHKLKPEMYVNSKIRAALGEKLSVPEDAVVDTGERKVIFRVLKDGRFSQKEIRTGITANGYTEIISGLQEGDEIVSSGVFFVDSESRLKSGGDQ